MKELLKSLPERKRRTFLRYVSQKSKTANNDADENKTNQGDNKEDFMKKLAQLKVNSDSDDENDEFEDFDDEDDNSSYEENSD